MTLIIFRNAQIYTNQTKTKDLILYSKIPKSFHCKIYSVKITSEWLASGLTELVSAMKIIHKHAAIHQQTSAMLALCF